ncbi:MAG: AMP-binding protein [Actinoplanes sp.]
MRLPLSEAQLGVWHALRIGPAGPAYDLGGYADLRGPLHAGRLERAVSAMAAEVPAFRVRFDDATDPVTQVVAPPSPVPLTRLDFDGPAESLAWMRADLAVPRDPTRDPLLETSLLRLGPDRHRWYVRSHHLVLDGYSVPLVCGRVAEIYTALTRGAEPGPSPFGPYRSLLDAETAYRASPQFAADRRFWLGRMAGAPDIPTLGTGTGAPLGPYHRVSTELPAAVAAALQAHGPGRAWVPVLMAAFAGYLARLTGAGELRLGVPMACRSGPLLRVPGNASNLLPLRVSVPPGVTAAELTAAVAAELGQVRRHQRYRGETLARDLGAAGIGPALFGPSVNIRDFDHDLAFGECRTTLEDVTTGPVEDLTLSVRRQDGRFHLYLAGNAGAYTRADVEAHLPRFVDYLAGFVEPSRPAGFESADQLRVRRSGGHRHGPGPAAGSLDLAAALVAQSRRTPDAVALRDRPRSWTFAALTDRVDRLAGALRRAGVGPETLVGLALPRSAEYVIGLLAVARAGGAWLPLDLSHPPELLARALRTSTPALVLVADPAPPLPAGLTLLPVTAEADAPEWPAAGPENLAYVVPTSGSTGRPHAVAITRGAVANLLASHREGSMSRLPRLRVGHTAPFTADAAVDPLLWMVAGHELVLIVDYQDPFALVAEDLDLVDVPPSYLRVLLDAGLAESHLVFGGEAVSQELWDRLRALPGRRLRLNAYGPTEFTVDALHAEVEAAAEPVLGTPVAASRALVLDGALRPVPEGGVGELPDHLVPSAIVPLPALPLAPDGTLDRRALPDPGPVGANAYRPPETATEAALCAGFAEVLHAEKIGVDDDFFSLGGDSLLAGRLQTVVRARLGVPLTLRTIFTHRTVHALARTLE